MENGEEKTDENSGHYVIASSRPPKRLPLEHRTLVPIWMLEQYRYRYESLSWYWNQNEFSGWYQYDCIGEILYLWEKLESMSFWH